MLPSFLQVDAALETAEAALADAFVRHGDLLAIRRRVLRLGKPPRRWKRPAWAAAVAAEPAEVRITGRPLAGSVGARNRWVVGSVTGCCLILGSRQRPLQAGAICLAI